MKRASALLCCCALGCGSSTEAPPEADLVAVADLRVDRADLARSPDLVESVDLAGADAEAVDAATGDLAPADLATLPDLVARADGGDLGPVDVKSKERAACMFGAGADTRATVGPNVPHGDQLPFQHVIVVMQENRSFDHYYSSLPAYGVKDVDVAMPKMSNPDPMTGGVVERFKETRYCTADVDHSWEGSHTQYNGGKNDGFVATNNPGGARAMGYYTDADLPYYYWLSKTFAISDRHFCSLLGPTWPNRYYFFAATSWGRTKTGDLPPLQTNKVFDILGKAGKSWKIYRDGAASSALMFGLQFAGVGMNEFDDDVNNDKLPHLAFIDPSYTGAGRNDEHPPGNIQAGQKFVKRVVDRVMSNPAVWRKSVVIITYDEHGGYYDHVPPPAACVPDGDKPPSSAFDRLGFRVPLIVVSPYAKKGYVSHTVTDLTSVTRFIENRFDLPAMTKRDANAWPLLDLFDFAQPPHLVPPGPAPSGEPSPMGLDWCKNNPPGTGRP